MSDFKKYLTPKNYLDYLQIQKQLRVQQSFKYQQWNSPDKIIFDQKKQLYKTLDYAIREIPYYSGISTKINFHFTQETIFQDLLRFPVLTKQIIRNFQRDLVNPDYLNSSQKQTSGGTTGEPVIVFQSKSFIEKCNQVHKMHLEWAGYRNGCKYLQIWGDEREIIDKKRKSDGIIKISDKHYILNSFKMSPLTIARYISFINNYKPDIIFSYVQSIYEICQFAKINKTFIYSPKGILTSAGTLYSEQRSLIEKVFTSPVFNKYGSREMNAMACECEMHSGLHLDTMLHYIELLDEDQKPVTRENQTGELYVTTLENPVMPLIRYQIGDRATYTSRQCLCKRGFPLIKNIKGRVVDIFINNIGEKIDGEYFTHLFYYSKTIKKFQLIQNRINNVIVNYETLENYQKSVLHRELSEIRKHITLVMGKKCRIGFRRLKHIRSLKSGKYRYTICRL